MAKKVKANYSKNKYGLGQFILTVVLLLLTVFFAAPVLLVFIAAFTDEERDSFVASIRRALLPGGRLIIVDNDLVTGQDLPYHGPYISKDLIVAQLYYYGFKVIDLGKDVPAEKIIETAKENNADIIALSALMTTTMQRMREVIANAKQEGLPSKVMIGGAVITQEYADEIGAEGYSKDAAEAVRLAQRLLHLL